MGRTYSIQKLFWVIGTAITVVAFNNCGQGFTILNSTSLGGSTEFSTANGETCEEAIVQVYASTFHPFLTQTCGGCHVAGGIGKGVFGSADVLTSYNAFTPVGRRKFLAKP
ncbi:hypothetical protein DOM22_11760 [Bdellovibrio sp. ZAP7]|uniref:hypothetical protein n=1 Tax=Bdellovibrio sp. ZAP7 TaxID=2231053 RepID=UPI001156C7F9|nr:hypothetical protein [Bdellovibrio sp. ZAP7]QDK45774.1 hypothetical protein DOM22_11760 [Bdellovibrio sp. ZAP7]